MAGTQTNGYDAVLEFSPFVIQNIVSAFFDADQHFKNDIFTPVFNTFPNPLSTLKLTDSFQVTVQELTVNPFDSPNDFEDDPDSVRIIMVMNDPAGTLGNQLSTINMIVGISFDTSNTEISSKFIMLDFKDKLHSFTVTLPAAVSTLLPGLQQKLEDKLKETNIGLIPLRVFPETTDPKRIAQAEIKLINGNSIQQDALAAMLTFGGGTSPGNLGVFTEAFDRQGAGAAITLGLNWVARLISPAVENSFNLEPGSFRDLSFSGSHDMGDGVKLVELSLTIVEDKILLDARIEKSGTCYDSSATLKAGITIGITNGTLTVGYIVEELDTDTDIGFWCWIIIGLLVGALVGTGIALGVGAVVASISISWGLALAGAIAGGGLGALLGVAIFAILEFLFTPLNQIMDTISGQLQSGINFELEIVPVDVDVDLQNAFIDDIAIGYAVYPAEYAQVKSEGTLIVRTGQYIDLDSGIVGNDSFGGADLQLAGAGNARNLKVQCGASLCHLPVSKFKHARRYHFYFAFSENLQTIPFSEICVRLPFGLLEYLPTLRVFGLRTSDGRFSVVQVINVTDNAMVIKYKTYASNELSVTIKGGFSCIPLPFVDREELIGEGFEPAALARIQKADDDGPEITFDHSIIAALQNVKRDKPVFISEVIRDLKVGTEKIAQPPASSTGAIGRWTKTVRGIRKKSYGNFRASVNSTSPIISYIWSVEGTALEQNSQGTVQVKGIDFDFVVQGKFLRLSSSHLDSFEFLVKVTVVSEQGNTQTAYRCVTYKNSCTYTVAVVPAFTDYLKKFDEVYGSPHIPMMEIKRE